MKNAQQERNRCGTGQDKEIFVFNKLEKKKKKKKKKKEEEEKEKKKEEEERRRRRRRRRRGGKALGLSVRFTLCNAGQVKTNPGRIL